MTDRTNLLDTLYKYGLLFKICNRQLFPVSLEVLSFREFLSLLESKDCYCRCWKTGGTIIQLHYSYLFNY